MSAGAGEAESESEAEAETGAETEAESESETGAETETESEAGHSPAERVAGPKSRGPATALVLNAEIAESAEIARCERERASETETEAETETESEAGHSPAERVAGPKSRGSATALVINAEIAESAEIARCERERASETEAETETESEAEAEAESEAGHSPAERVAGPKSRGPATALVLNAEIAESAEIARCERERASETETEAETEAESEAASEVESRPRRTRRCRRAVMAGRADEGERVRAEIAEARRGHPIGRGRDFESGGGSSSAESESESEGTARALDISAEIAEARRGPHERRGRGSEAGIVRTETETAAESALLPRLLDTLEAGLRRVRWLVLLGLVVWLAILAVRHAEDPGRGDTRFYREAAQRFWAGERLYFHDPLAPASGSAGPPGGYRRGTGYTYLPPFAALSGWMRWLPYPAVRVLWLLLSALALALLAREVGRLARWGSPGQGPRRPHLAALCLALLVGRFVANDLAHGQTNILIALALAHALRAGRDGREGRAGALLGAALVIKPTSGLLLPWLLLERRWRTAAACAVTGAGALLLTAALYPGDALAEHLEWVRLSRRFASEAVAENNAALAPTLARGLAAAGAPGPVALERARLLAAALVGLALLALWRRRPAEPARAWCAVLPLSALLSPVTWKAHLVVLLLPGAWVVRWLDALAPPARAPAARWAWPCFGLCVALLLVPSRGLLGLAALERWGGLTAALALLAALTAASGAQEAQPAALGAEGPQGRQLGAGIVGAVPAAAAAAEDGRERQDEA